jgi:hypothetical protein
MAFNRLDSVVQIVIVKVKPTLELTIIDKSAILDHKEVAGFFSVSPS